MFCGRIPDHVSVADVENSQCSMLQPAGGGQVWSVSYAPNAFPETPSTVT